MSHVFDLCSFSHCPLGSCHSAASEMESETFVFSVERVSLSLCSVVAALAAACVVEMAKRSHFFLSEGVSLSLRSVDVCPAAAALEEEMAMRSRIVLSEVFLALVLSRVLGLCLFCCAQAFSSALVTSKSREDKELGRCKTTF